MAKNHDTVAADCAVILPAAGSETKGWRTHEKGKDWRTHKVRDEKTWKIGYWKNFHYSGFQYFEPYLSFLNILGHFCEFWKFSNSEIFKDLTLSAMAPWDVIDSLGGAQSARICKKHHLTMKFCIYPQDAFRTLYFSSFFYFLFFFGGGQGKYLGGFN